MGLAVGSVTRKASPLQRGLAPGQVATKRWLTVASRSRWPSDSRMGVAPPVWPVSTFQSVPLVVAIVMSPHDRFSSALAEPWNVPWCCA